MYRRKDIRYSIARCRKPGEHPAENQEIYDWVMAQKPAELDVNGFPDKWDIIVAKGKIAFVEPERDISYIQATCAEAKVLSKHGIGFDDLTDRQINIIKIIELAMLDNLMSWENYAEAWRVILDADNGKINTQLLGSPMGQKAVTPEMIEDSHTTRKERLSEETQTRIADKEAGVSYDHTVDLSGGDAWQTMTTEEVAAFKKATGNEG